ncbi:hypothetical protein CK203_044629 [Vitis vinifera]|uniref:Uncharacterized protein n=1 Tax=Vitis vinifera TaxID=29760 RepID=A0A438HJL4_VITVI|nr:hypothetical protein CK203_044629 [Vitis vinifera]
MPVSRDKFEGLHEPTPEVPSSAAQATPQPPLSFHLNQRHLLQLSQGADSCYSSQHTAILRQIQHHLGITSTPKHAILSPPEPSQAPPFVDQPMSHEEPPTGEAAELSFPQHHPPTI